MKLLSVNLSVPKEITYAGKTVTTGIFKKPTSERVMLRTLNLDGDGQADLWGHGGAFRAVYVYSKENYGFWERELERDDFTYGQFGENFTVEGMLDDQIHVGDTFRVGGALVEVSQPRIPCYKLAIKMGIDGFQNRFMQSGRVGFYFRVLEEGEVGSGDEIELVGRDPRRMTIREVNDLLFFDKKNLDGTREACPFQRSLTGGRVLSRSGWPKRKSRGRSRTDFVVLWLIERCRRVSPSPHFIWYPRTALD